MDTADRLREQESGEEVMSFREKKGGRGREEGQEKNNSFWKDHRDESVIQRLGRLSGGGAVATAGHENMKADVSYSSIAA